MARPIYLTQFRLIQAQANEVLEQAREHIGLPSTAPVLADLIAQNLFSLQCRSRFMRQHGKRTAASLSPDTRTIYVDKRLTFPQRNFAIARELGHLILHEGQDDILSGEHGGETVRLSLVLRSAWTKTEKEQQRLREIEANLFAAALIMPRQALEKAANWYILIDNHALRQLAREFAVSIAMMRYRIKDLVAHDSWYGPSIQFEDLWSPARYLRYRDTPSHDYDYLQEYQSELPENSCFKQPRLIEFCGTSNAGKDTLIGVTSDYLQDVCGYKVRVIDEAIKSCHIDKTLDTERLLKTVALTVVQLYEAYYENPGNYDYVIFNRGLFDRLALLEASRALGHISDEQASVHSNYLLSYTKFLYLVLLFQISPEESLKREWLSKRNIVATLAELENKPLPDQRILNEKTLHALNEAYLNVYSTHGNKFKCTHVYQGDSTTVEERALYLRKLLHHGDPIQPYLPELGGLSEESSESSQSRFIARAKNKTQYARNASRRAKRNGLVGMTVKQHSLPLAL